MGSEGTENNRYKSSAGFVSTLYRCPTEKATDLCIYDVAEKLKSPGMYDIGGTYNDDEGEFWFYYTTSNCHGYNDLLNLFVLPRKACNFSIKLPKMIKLSSRFKIDEDKFTICLGPQTELSFRTTRKDEHVYVTTLRFDRDDVKALEKCILLVPIVIQQYSKLQLDVNIVTGIKINHNLSCLKDQNDTKDFFLISSSGKRYPIHKILVAAHSPVLRQKLHNSEQSLTLDMSDEAMEIIIEFLYTGTLDLDKQDFMMLLDSADSLQLRSLFASLQQIIGDKIHVDNAVNIAITAKKYGLENLSIQVFDFIKSNPKVMATKAWSSLEDADLLKQMLQYMHLSPHNMVM